MRVPGKWSLLREPSRYVQLSQIIRQLESWRRPFVISYLSRHFTCGLFGEGNLEAWGAETTPLGYVTHEEQARTYCRGRVGLNVMRWQDDVGLNLKPLEIAASGVACLCERRPGLDEVFEPGREIIAFDTPGEARRLLAGLLDDAEKRRIIADAGRQRVLRDHTWTTRADQLCAPIGAATGLW